MKNIIICLILIINLLIFLFSCKFGSFNKYDINKNINNANIANDVSNDLFNIDRVKVYNLLNLKDIEIIVPQCQIDAQNYSIIFKNKNNELIIFDGGRVEDANYLLSIIEKYGGVVSAWFLSHIHDDHIGALYQILSNKNTNIKIKNIFYNFATFSWYYEKIGNDAGALVLFENALNEYIELQKTYGTYINVNNSIKMNDIFNFSNIDVEVINNILLMDSDPINNSTIVYKVYFENHTLLSLGDLGYYGGEKLLDTINNDKFKSDIVVVSHHGQNGVSEKFYEKINPIYSIWPTTRAIYENKDNKYNTNDTINVLNKLNVKYFLKSYEGTFIIR